MRNLQGWKIFISWEAGLFSHNLLSVFMYKKNKISL